MPDQFVSQVFLDERLMHPLHQAGFGKLFESAGEGGFGGQLLAQPKTADAPQRPVDGQALDQAGRGRQPQHGLGHKGIRQPGALAGRTTDARPGRHREFLDAHPFQGVDHFFQFRRQRADLVLQFGQQFVLNHMPALQDRFASDSIHGAGVMMLALRTASCQKWPPAPSVSFPARKKSLAQSAFCKRLKCHRS
jgi:hypothetical protein